MDGKKRRRYMDKLYLDELYLDELYDYIYIYYIYILYIYIYIGSNASSFLHKPIIRSHLGGPGIAVKEDGCD